MLWEKDYIHLYFTYFKHANSLCCLSLVEMSQIATGIVEYTMYKHVLNCAGNCNKNNIVNMCVFLAQGDLMFNV